jgi:hypothetical protein
MQKSSFKNILNDENKKKKINCSKLSGFVLKYVRKMIESLFINTYQTNDHILNVKKMIDLF